MNWTKRLWTASLAVCAVLCSLTAQLAFATVPTGYVMVSGYNLSDSTGTLIANATISFQPVTSTGTPISFRVGTAAGGQTSYLPVTATVTAGVFNVQLADTALTDPVNVCYAVTVTDNVTGNSLLGPGYSCVQPQAQTTNYWCVSGTKICDFDLYIPNLAPGLTVETGPTGPPGPTGAAGPAGLSNGMINVKAAPYNAVCDGVTDDSTAIQSALTAGQTVTGDAGFNTVLIPASCAAHNLRMSGYQSLAGNGAGVSRLILNDPTANLLTVVPSPLPSWNIPGNSSITGLAFAGGDSATAGTLLEIDGAQNIDLEHDAFVDDGGKGLEVNGAGERLTGRHLLFSLVRQSIALNGAPNEIHLEDFRSVFSGYTYAAGTTTPYCYGLNCTAGVFASSGALVPEPMAQVYVGAGTNIHFNDCSIKPNEFSSGLQDYFGGLSVQSCYIEQAYQNDGVIEGGVARTYTLATALTATSTSSTVTSAQWGPHYGNPSDLAAYPDYDYYILKPNDYCGAGDTDVNGNACSTTYSDLDPGHTLGIFEASFEEIAVTGFTTGNAFTIAARALGGTTAIAWPVGVSGNSTQMESYAGPYEATLNLVDDHLHGVHAPLSGYTFNIDQSGCRSSAEVVAGQIPCGGHGFIEPPGHKNSSWVQPVKLTVNNPNMVTGLAEQGEILAHSTVLLDVIGLNSVPDADWGAPPYIVPLGPSIGGSYAQAASYPNGNGTPTYAELRLVNPESKMISDTDINDPGYEAAVTNTAIQALQGPTLQVQNELNIVGGPGLLLQTAPTTLATGGTLPAFTNISYRQAYAYYSPIFTINSPGMNYSYTVVTVNTCPNGKGFIGADAPNHGALVVHFNPGAGCTATPPGGGPIVVTVQNTLGGVGTGAVITATMGYQNGPISPPTVIETTSTQKQFTIPAPGADPSGAATGYLTWVGSEGFEQLPASPTPTAVTASYTVSSLVTGGTAIPVPSCQVYCSPIDEAVFAFFPNSEMESGFYLNHINPTYNTVSTFFGASYENGVQIYGPGGEVLTGCLQMEGSAPGAVGSINQPCYVPDGSSLTGGGLTAVTGVGTGNYGSGLTNGTYNLTSTSGCGTAAVISVTVASGQLTGNPTVVTPGANCSAPVFTPSAGTLPSLTYAISNTLSVNSLAASAISSGTIAAARLPVGSSSALGAVEADGVTVGTQGITGVTGVTGSNHGSGLTNGTLTLTSTSGCATPAIISATVASGVVTANPTVTYAGSGCTTPVFTASSGTFPTLTYAIGSPGVISVLGGSSGSSSGTVINTSPLVTNAVALGAGANALATNPVYLVQESSGGSASPGVENLNLGWNSNNTTFGQTGVPGQLCAPQIGNRWNAACFPSTGTISGGQSLFRVSATAANNTSLPSGWTLATNQIATSYEWGLFPGMSIYPNGSGLTFTTGGTPNCQYPYSTGCTPATITSVAYAGGQNFYVTLTTSATISGSLGGNPIVAVTPSVYAMAGTSATTHGPDGSGNYNTQADFAANYVFWYTDQLAIQASYMPVTGVSGSGGSGMTSGTYPLSFSGGSGSGAAANLIVTGPSAYSISMTANGAGYSSAPAVAISGPGPGGTPPTLTATVAQSCAKGECAQTLEFPAGAYLVESSHERPHSTNASVNIDGDGSGNTSFYTRNNYLGTPTGYGMCTGCQTSYSFTTGTLTGPGNPSGTTMNNGAFANPAGAPMWRHMTEPNQDQAKLEAHGLYLTEAYAYDGIWRMYGATNENNHDIIMRDVQIGDYPTFEIGAECTTHYPQGSSLGGPNGSCTIGDTSSGWSGMVGAFADTLEENMSAIRTQSAPGPQNGTEGYGNWVLTKTGSGLTGNVNGTNSASVVNGFSGTITDTGGTTHTYTGNVMQLALTYANPSAVASNNLQPLFTYQLIGHNAGQGAYTQPCDTMPTQSQFTPVIDSQDSQFAYVKYVTIAGSANCNMNDVWLLVSAATNQNYVQKFFVSDSESGKDECTGGWGIACFYWGKHGGHDMDHWHVFSQNGWPTPRGGIDFNGALIFYNYNADTVSGIGFDNEALEATGSSLKGDQFYPYNYYQGGDPINDQGATAFFIGNPNAVITAHGSICGDLQTAGGFYNLVVAGIGPIDARQYPNFNVVGGTDCGVGPLSGVAATGTAAGMTAGVYPLVFSGGNGINAAGYITVTSATAYSQPVITNYGSGYNTPPTVTAATGGTPPTLTASLALGNNENVLPGLDIGASGVATNAYPTASATFMPSFSLNFDASLITLGVNAIPYLSTDQCYHYANWSSSTEHDGLECVFDPNAYGVTGNPVQSVFFNNPTAAVSGQSMELQRRETYNYWSGAASHLAEFDDTDDMNTNTGTPTIQQRNSTCTNADSLPCLQVFGYGIETSQSPGTLDNQDWVLSSGSGGITNVTVTGTNSGYTSGYQTLTDTSGNCGHPPVIEVDVVTGAIAAGSQTILDAGAACVSPGPTFTPAGAGTGFAYTYTTGYVKTTVDSILNNGDAVISGIPTSAASTLTVAPPSFTIPAATDKPMFKMVCLPSSGFSGFDLFQGATEVANMSCSGHLNVPFVSSYAGSAYGQIALGSSTAPTAFTRSQGDSVGVASFTSVGTGTSVITSNSGGGYQLLMGSGGSSQTAFGTTAGNNGLLALYDGVTPAGFGMPVIVGSWQAHTATAAVPVTSITAGATAQYRLSASLYCQGSATGETLQFLYSYVDPFGVTQNGTSGTATTCPTTGDAVIQVDSLPVEIESGQTMSWHTVVSATSPTYHYEVQIQQLNNQ